MREAESAIINHLIKYQYEPAYTKLETLTLEPMGSASIEFLQNSHIDTFVIMLYVDRRLQNAAFSKGYFKLWQAIELYLKNVVPIQDLEKQLNQVLSLNNFDVYTHGTAKMLPGKLSDRSFIRRLYDTKDRPLIDLFLKYIPKPHAHVFQNDSIPTEVKAEEEAAVHTVTQINTLSAEPHILRMQRNFRAAARDKKNLTLWSGHYELTEEETQSIFTEANTPYRPQCDQALSTRIMKATEHIVLFDTVKHLTAPTAVKSIFNDALYGRETLVSFFMPFKNASLSLADIQNGDANVICMGAHHIDPRSKHGITLTFDVNGLMKNNPTLFYKQRDLAYDVQEMRHLEIADLNLDFCHTTRTQFNKGTDSDFKYYPDPKKPYSSFTASIKNALLIASNKKEMHQILILNFFRFFDKLGGWIQKDIYTAMNQLDDSALKDTLTTIGQLMTDTMEFNFYGAHQIDFDTLLIISSDSPPYQLVIKDFIRDLNHGNIDKLNEAIKNLPDAFSSYRFVNYLISKTTSEPMLTALKDHKATHCAMTMLEKVLDQQATQRPLTLLRSSPRVPPTLVDKTGACSHPIVLNQY